uniref:Uncharacterized protein n=1 Tax=Anguilla anguilla TaxID=7936 RepID=A0A0E9PVU5_ANGAN
MHIEHQRKNIKRNINAPFEARFHQNKPTTGYTRTVKTNQLA